MFKWFRDQAMLIIAAYIALLVVMGGRTALFVSNFDNLLEVDIFGGKITALSILMAVALMLAVAGTSWWRSHYTRRDSARQVATWSMVGAVVLDGAFNVSEAIMLATETGTLDAYSGVVKIWLWFTVLLIGVGPTLLTMGLASLAGAVDRDARKSTTTSRRTSTAVNVSIARQTVETNDALDDHLSVIVGELSAGDQFRRTDVERLTGLKKAQAINVINHGLDAGVFDSPKRGSYVVIGEE